VLDSLLQTGVIALVGMSVVFLSMVLLIGAVVATRAVSRLHLSARAPAPAPAAAPNPGEPGDEELVAVIAAALALADRSQCAPRLRDLRRTAPPEWVRGPAEHQWASERRMR